MPAVGAKNQNTKSYKEDYKKFVLPARTHKYKA